MKLRDLGPPAAPTREEWDRTQAAVGQMLFGQATPPPPLPEYSYQPGQTVAEVTGGPRPPTEADLAFLTQFGPGIIAAPSKFLPWDSRWVGPEYQAPWENPDLTASWRREISDEDFRLHPDWKEVLQRDVEDRNRLRSGYWQGPYQAGQSVADYTAQSGYRPITVGDLAEHPDLFDAYPDIKDIELSSAVAPGSRGTYWGRSSDDPQGRLALSTYSGDYGKNVGSAEGTLLHEIQHAIQDREGWVRGANSETFLHPDVNTLIKGTPALTRQITQDMAKRYGFHPDPYTFMRWVQQKGPQEEGWSLIGTHDLGYRDTPDGPLRFMTKPDQRQIWADLQQSPHWPTVRETANLDRAAKGHRTKGEDAYRRAGGEIEARTVQRKYDDYLSFEALSPETRDGDVFNWAAPVQRYWDIEPRLALDPATFQLPDDPHAYSLYLALGGKPTRK